MRYDKVEVPTEGDRITLVDDETDKLDVPDDPIVPIIHGDGIGVDVGPAAQEVLQAAANATGRDINWMRVYAGETAREKHDENPPTNRRRADRIGRVATDSHPRSVTTRTSKPLA